jgi:hypothetical protein
MNRPHILRLLRIAVSVVCLGACALTIAVWVRHFGVRLDQRKPILEVGNFAVYSSRGLILAMKAPFVEIDPTYAARVSYVIPRRFQVTPSEPPIRDPNMSQGGVRVAIWSRGIWAIQAPCWLLVIITAVIGAAPWLRWSFSLRTLLMVTAFVAVVLGLVVMSSRGN